LDTIVPLGAVEDASLEKAGEKRTIVPLGTVEDASLVQPA